LGQAGQWDVDGTGIQKIADDDVARALNDKVNAFNSKVATRTIPPALIFCFFPFQTVFAALRHLLPN